MPAPSPPHTLSIPPAPRIGTAGSPLDPPSITSRQPREGLGLGGIEMPEGMKGTAEDDKAFKPQRSGHLRHAASVSSPPSLIPFVKSLHSTPSNPPAPSVTSRKFSLQPQVSTHSGHSRKASEGIISYPIVSRIDSLPTFTPDEERRPAPVPTTTINDYRSSGVPIPAGVTRTVVDEDRTPTPKQRRPSRTTRSPPPPLDLDFSGGSNYSVFPVRPAATSSRVRRESNATTPTEKPEKVASNTGRLRGLRISHGSSRASSQFDSSDEDDSPMIGSSSSRRGSHAVSKSSYPGHRRTASEESPRIVQAMTFNRAKSAEDVLPSDLPVRHLPGGVQPTRTWNTASPALIPISEVKAAKAKARAQALDSPTRKTGVQSTSSRTPTNRQAPESISISVKDSVQTREFGKAVVGKEGLTVCLRSYTKPEDMEVSWSCVSRTDEEGRPFTQWEMKFKPRSTNSSSSGGFPPLQPLPPLPAPSLASSNSSFLNYRINAPSPSPSSANYPPQIGRTCSTTSPLSQTIDPLAASSSSSSSQSVPPVEPRRRKSSSTSTTSRSDSFSNGTSFSSESSFGPPTPASSVSGSGHRRRKSSISHTLSSHDLSEEKEVPPPLPTASYFDIPVPPATTTSIRNLQREDHSISPSRTNRSSSYNVGKSTRQFSIDQSVQVPRSASVPEVGIRHASSSSQTSVTSSQKSPTKDNRFARCLPPSGESKLDLSNLTSSSSTPLSSSSGGSFLASRQSSRKQSFAAPPPSLSIPPTQSLVEESTHRLTSPFTPSPLGRSSNNSISYGTTSSSNSSISSILGGGGGGDQNRTPTRSSHFIKSATTTTPSPPPPASTSYYTLNKDYYGESRTGGGGGGTSEELVSSHHHSRSISPSPSPCFSHSNDDEDEDDDDEEEEEEDNRERNNRMIRMRQGKRMMSRWSDTETEEEEQQQQEVGLTSWGKLPDASSIMTTTDEE
ncbi:hypothetical protein JCM5350_006415 [Sporobolomyces pararoseus]